MLEIMSVRCEGKVEKREGNKKTYMDVGAVWLQSSANFAVRRTCVDNRSAGLKQKNRNKDLPDEGFLLQ